VILDNLTLKKELRLEIKGLKFFRFSDHSLLP
jgi:hypothetical protein